MRIVLANNYCQHFLIKDSTLTESRWIELIQLNLKIVDLIDMIGTRGKKEMY